LKFYINLRQNLNVMKVKIKRLNNEVYQFDDVIDIKIEAVELIQTNNNYTAQSQEKKKQIYVCNEVGNWGVDIIKETERAVLVSNGEKQIWLPKSKLVGNKIKEKDFNYFLNKT